MLPIIYQFMGPPINLTGGIFTTVTGLSESILYFVNWTTVRWYYPYFINDECASKENSVDALSTSFYLHNYVALLYCGIIPKSQIILSGW